MLRRAFASFLVVLLSWSALATQEHAFVAGSDAAIVTISDPRVPPGLALSGSIDEHHLDDQPAQTLADPTIDLPTWFPATAAALPGSVAGVRPATVPTAGPTPVAVGVPDRPPRA